MNAIILTQATPLFEDKDGTIRIIGSRIPAVEPYNRRIG